MNGHNPGVIPGYYNPNQQTKTEAFDYQAFVGTEFVDPTTIPMHPRDTVVPMQPPERPIQQQPPASLPMQSTVQQPQSSPQVFENQNLYQKRMELEYQQTPRRSVETIRIPISIELTISLNIKPYVQ